MTDDNVIPFRKSPKVSPGDMKRITEDPDYEITLSELAGLNVTLKCQTINQVRLFTATARLKCANISTSDTSYPKAIRQLVKLCRGREGTE